jgi:hypothetical protein
MFKFRDTKVWRAMNKIEELRVASRTPSMVHR